MRMRWFALFALLLYILPATCRADFTTGVPTNWGVNMVIFAPTGQSFTADAAALKSVGMFISVCNCPNDPPIQYQMNLLNGAGTTGTLIAARTATAPIGLNGFLDFDFTGVTLVPGQIYTAVITQISPSPPSQGVGTSLNGGAATYAGGMAFISGQPRPDLDFALRVVDLPTQPALQYAAKFVCGQSNDPIPAAAAVAAGTYFTTINVHNSAEKEIEARMKVAAVKPNGEPGTISTFFPIKLRADQAMAVECSQIHKMSGVSSPFLEGFVVIESDSSLDVISVYTGGPGGRLQTLAIERVPERKWR